MFHKEVDNQLGKKVEGLSDKHQIVTIGFKTSLHVFAISFSIIRDKFTPEKLAVAQGIFSSMFSAGAVVGVAIGGTIINNFGWHATFFLVIPIAIALFVSISRFIHIDEATARISDKNTEFCCRFIHVRRDILLSESSITVEYGSGNNKSRSTVDITGAITLSIAVVLHPQLLNDSKNIAM